MEESLVSFYGVFKERNIEPEIRLPEEPVWKTLDKEAISRVFSNIISNAIKYSEGDFSVSMTESGVITFSNIARKMDAVSVSLSGNVTEKSISDHREYFFGKSVHEIEKYLNRRGYQTKIRPSNRPDSKATVITVLNHTHEHNITQVLVSPGSKRHGDVPYVKISTDNGRYKVINSRPEDYKTDGKEKAKLFFRRYW